MECGRSVPKMPGYSLGVLPMIEHAGFWWKQKTQANRMPDRVVSHGNLVFRELTQSY
jgi:hypothetical protein